jgi:hypothetical protein
MTGDPEKLKNMDLERVDCVVRLHLQKKYLDHPTRGPYVKSGELFEDVEEEIDDRLGRELFGMFCESRDYLQKWSRGYRGSSRYRIVEEDLSDGTCADM